MSELVFEPEQYFQESLEINLKIMPAEGKVTQTNIFKDATFWFNKGYSIQVVRYKPIKNQKDNVDLIALDYYLSGFKIDRDHLGCIYNTGCCMYFTGKFANAERWFTYGIQTSNNPSCYMGKTLACLKLGQYEIALQTVSTLRQMKEWHSDEFTPFQAVFLHAVCLRLVRQWERAFDLYQEMSDGIQTSLKHRIKDQTIAVLLLPLEA